ncbi:MAG TPA: glycosyl hydrolase family 17 protein [Candidatus Acidoferrum sp.]|jgi:exo-beta-1,3-glucanase (GH17 family)|nr:glycosyl hydrolase family 17 protein [Candidatus Acidoferrum sp.]
MATLNYMTKPTLYPAFCLLVWLTACGGGSSQRNPTNGNNPPPLSFLDVPPITVSLGTKVPAVDLSQHVQGGSAPYSYSLLSQSAPNVITCALNSATLSSDYAYQGGVNMIKVQVTDGKGANATTVVTVTVNVPVVATPLYGIDFGPYEAGQDPATGIDLSTDQITQRMGVIAPYAKWIRSYGSTHGLENIGAIGHKFGLKICLGASITNDTSANAIEMTNLIAHALNGEADCAVVGTEVLFNNFPNVPPTQLTAYIDQFRAAVPTVPVTTADTYLSLLNSPQVVNDCDFVFVNYYPYWEGMDVSVALADLNAEDALLRRTYPNKEVIVSETGWPSGGNAKGNAVPSVANAAEYLLDFESWAQAGQRKAFYFDAFDEAYKATADAPQQALFGIFDQYAVMKYGNNVFAGATQADNWSCTTIPGGAGTPTVQFTSVPPLGSSNFLQGQELHMAPGDFYVTIYIHVGSTGWWVKPYLTSPLTIIYCDGTWTANIVTGGNDTSADQIAAFLIPSNYNPPLLTGAQTLPPDLYNNAVANVTVSRP